MATRLAYAYVRFLMVWEVLLFGLSLVVHVSAVIGVKQPFLRLAAMLEPVSFVTGLSAFAFLKDGLHWWRQIRRCPKWMWIGCLGIIVYNLGIFFGERPAQAVSFSDQMVLASGFPLIFDAIALCILYPVLWSDYLGKSEVPRRVLQSIFVIVVQIASLMAYRAGYLPPDSIVVNRDFGRLL